MVQTETTFNPEELKKRFNPEGSQIRRHQLKMLEMVKELDRICKKHNIPYFLYGGTLLGAIRHNGFIPWDDDLDVGLRHKDYVKLMKVLPQELPEHIALQTNKTDKNYFYFFAKLRDKHSLLDEGNIYEQYYSKDPKTFLQVLEIIKEIGAKRVAEGLSTLVKISPFDLSADKVKVVCDSLKHDDNSITGQEGGSTLERKIKDSLCQYDRLREVMNPGKKVAV